MADDDRELATGGGRESTVIDRLISNKLRIDKRCAVTVERKEHEQDPDNRNRQPVE